MAVELPDKKIPPLTEDTIKPCTIICAMSTRTRWSLRNGGAGPLDLAQRQRPITFPRSSMSGALLAPTLHNCMGTRSKDIRRKNFDFRRFALSVCSLLRLASCQSVRDTY